jgi:hypothetical protein
LFELKELILTGNPLVCLAFACQRKALCLE